MIRESYLDYSCFRYEDHHISERSESLLVESPLSISINDEPWTLTMQTPGDEVYLAAGLAFTEGVLPKDALNMDCFTFSRQEERSLVTIYADAQRIRRDEMRKRTLLSLSSCGICGRTELPSVTRQDKMIREGLPYSISHLIQKMQEAQSLFIQTGGCHAAAAFSENGELLCCYEDIGRHNAVDKVIGALILQNRMKEAKVMTVSSRVSYEIIIKAYAAAVPVIAAVSAPSSMAVDMAKEFGISLYGFCRDGRYTRYA